MTDEHTRGEMETDVLIDGAGAISHHNGLTIQRDIFKSKMSIEHGAITIYSKRDYPNAWHRFWYRVLLGWKWSRVRDEQPPAD